MGSDNRFPNLPGRNTPEDIAMDPATARAHADATELREFYIQQDRRRERIRRIVIAAAVVVAIVAIFWLSWRS